jgi:hypothetical protein
MLIKMTTVFDILITFDTTGSMNRVIDQVKNSISEMVEKLSNDIPTINIGIIAHGDYGDIYTTKIQQFTNDLNVIKQFILNVENTSGGDFEECYELVLQQAHTKLNWRNGAKHRMIMIGDATPHLVGDKRNLQGIDWEIELGILINNFNIKIYSIQAYDNHKSKWFWNDLALKSNGLFLPLKDIKNVTTLILGLCYYEHGSFSFDDFELSVRKSSGLLNDDVSNMINSLKRQDTLEKVVKSKIDTKLSLKKNRKTFKNNISSSKSVVKKRVTFKHKIAKVLPNKKIRRELVMNKRFITNSWSKWMLAAQPGIFNDKYWQSNKHYSSRIRFHLWKLIPNVIYHYELAVQSILNGKRIVVYNDYITNNNFNKNENVNIDKILKEKPEIEKQAIAVLSKGMKIFIRFRRHTTSSKKIQNIINLKQNLIRDYSFAWESCRPLRYRSAFISMKNI